MGQPQQYVESYIAIHNFHTLTLLKEKTTTCATQHTGLCICCQSKQCHSTALCKTTNHTSTLLSSARLLSVIHYYQHFPFLPRNYTIKFYILFPWYFRAKIVWYYHSIHNNDCKITDHFEHHLTGSSIILLLVIKKYTNIKLYSLFKNKKVGTCFFTSLVNQAMAIELDHDVSDVRFLNYYQKYLTPLGKDTPATLAVHNSGFHRHFWKSMVDVSNFP